MGVDAPMKISALLYHVQIKQDADRKKSNERRGTDGAETDRCIHDGSAWVST